MTIGQIASSVTPGTQSVQNARFQSEINTFANLISAMKNEAAEKEAVSNVSSSQIVEDGHINGDYKKGFSGLYTAESDKSSLPEGAAANSASLSADKKIDRTSKLYEKSLELESYFVKMLVSSMRKTVVKADGKSSYANSMYEDMMYDQYSEDLTKNAHFGLADQIYQELSGGITA